MDANVDIHDSSFELGLVVLLVAQMLSSYMGIYVQDMYAAHGNHWQENLFYSHIFSIPLFLPLQPMLATQYATLLDSPAPQIPSQLESHLPSPVKALITKTSTSLYHLALNSITQLVCITGVNLLGSKSSAVTVTIVLNIRKLVSFMLSFWIFGNHLSGLMVVGAVLVFGAGALYGWETTVGIKRRKEAEALTRENGAVKVEKMERKEL
jgi:drug/metabolite transporter (DMT)-like permease